MTNKRSSKKTNNRSSENSRGYSERKVEMREPRKRFLIVCEGKKTEPNYFRGFRVPKNVIDIDILGLGENTIGLVKEARDLRDKDGDYDQVWCVFDRDSFPAQDFNADFNVAQSNNINIAYSNEAFELWYLLHFHFYNTAISRDDYKKMLTNLRGREDKKNSETIYEELESLQLAAIKNARRLLQEYDPPNPEKDNPSTTVHLLVEELNKYIPSS